MFPLLPVDYGNSVILVCVGGVLFFIGALTMYTNGFFTVFDEQRPALSKQITWSLALKVACILVATLVVFDTDRSLNAKLGLSMLNASISWFLLG